MAVVYSSPIEAPASDAAFVDGHYDRDKDRELEEGFLAELREALRERALAGGYEVEDSLIGKEVRWPRGDGYARYMVALEEPLELIWLEIGDAWSVEDALVRGLTLDDVRDVVGRSERLAELFGRSSS